jgi:transcriptional regulator with XRE-family HTH domain
MKKNIHMTKKKLTVHLGEVLRAARLKAELTQADVAERVGVVTEMYERMERGNLTPSVLNLRKLCMVLRLDADAALGLEADEAAAWIRALLGGFAAPAPAATHLAPVGREAAHGRQLHGAQPRTANGRAAAVPRARKGRRKPCLTARSAL